MHVKKIEESGRPWVERETLRAVGRVGVMARACERHWLWLLGACSVLYAVVIGLIAVRKQLENDELFTLYIAKLPSMADVWAALMAGGEQLPPFFYVLTRASLSAFGDSSLALRLPAILGFWLMCLCLFAFVAKRSSVLHGTVAMLFVLTTGAYYYAFEARPYGLVLGFCGVALVCWQSLAEGGRRRAVPLIGLTVSLGAANACHYYAVLALLPFACGEVARMASRRRVDLAVWASLAASLAPFGLFIPLIEAARAYSTAFWAQPSWGNIPDFFFFMLTPAALPLTGTLILAALYFAILPESAHEHVEARQSGLRSYEVTAALGFLAIPFVAVALAMFVTGAFTDRYAMPATLGLGILVPIGFCQVLRGQNALTVVLVLCLAAGLARRGGMTLQESAKYVQTREGVIAMLQADRTGIEPVVCSDPRLFLLLSHYAPPELRSRLVYLADPAESMRYLGHNSVERGVLDLLKPWFGLNVQSYRHSLDSGRPFLLVGEPQYFLNWVLQALVASGARMELKGRHQEVLLFRVSQQTRD